MIYAPLKFMYLFVLSFLFFNNIVKAKLLEEDLRPEYLAILNSKGSAVFCEILIKPGDHVLKEISLPFEKGTQEQKEKVDTILSTNETPATDSKNGNTSPRMLINQLKKDKPIKETNLNSISILRDVDFNLLGHKDTEFNKDMAIKEVSNKSLNSQDLVLKDKGNEKDEKPAKDETQNESKDKSQLLKPSANEQSTGSNNDKENMHSVYMRCRLPLESRTETQRFSGKCNSKDKKFTVTYQVKSGLKPEIFNFNFNDSNPDMKLYFLKELSYNKGNRLAFNHQECKLELKHGWIWGIYIVGISALYFIS